MSERVMTGEEIQPMDDESIERLRADASALIHAENRQTRAIALSDLQLLATIDRLRARLAEVEGAGKILAEELSYTLDCLNAVNLVVSPKQCIPCNCMADAVQQLKARATAAEAERDRLLDDVRSARRFVGDLRVPQDTWQAAVQVRSAKNLIERLDAALARAGGGEGEGTAPNPP